MARIDSEILFFSEGTSFSLPQQNKTAKWLIDVAKLQKKRIHVLYYFFVSDKQLLSINKKFLKHNTYTDIITFDYSTLGENQKALQGEIYISIERVKENAKKFKTSQKKELHRVMAHGLLHLCGFNDDTAKEKKQMRSQEEIALDLCQF